MVGVMREFKTRSEAGEKPAEKQPEAAPEALVEALGMARTAWISDTHLGTRGAKAEALLRFLESLEGLETLYLVGDIVDGWRLRKRWYWPAEHEAVMAKFRAMADSGIRVIYLPGNHDEFMRLHLDADAISQSHKMPVVDDCIHTAADGKRYLVLHGDQFDVIVKYAKWLAHLGDKAYVFLLWFNRLFEQGRRQMRASAKWSLSAYLKGKVKTAVEYLSRYERVLVHIARDQKVDGIICGHIHRAETREIEGILYCNDGDWVESCTALLERPDGRLEVIRWRDVTAAALAATRKAA
jgi:UDP-2,3-diacylglucosamine pyrophosphatase LpxH